MKLVRRSLRATAIAWLCLQAATLAVFIPQACCLGHATPVSARTPQPECPMHPAPPPASECRMTAGCGGPTAVVPMSMTVAAVTVSQFHFDPVITSRPIGVVFSPVFEADTHSTTPPPKA